VKICLVTACTFDGERGTADRSEPLDEDSPLGVLSLAAATRGLGHEVTVCDLNHFVRELAGPGDLAQAAAEWVGSTSADLYGFSTISSSYPFTIRVAAAVHDRAPSRPIVCGGPQATVTDRELLRACSWIDVVVRGEAERAFPDLLSALAGGAPIEEVAGVTFRQDGVPRRTTDAPVVLDLDSLADPAHDLDIGVNRRLFGSVEIGRGCPFACEFCSTNDFFRRKFRLKSPERVIREMRAVRAAYGHETFSLVHDMFTVDRKRVLAFCEAMRVSGDGMRWSCSARTDCVDEELLDRMAEAGCNSLFFGIESGSPDMQRRMGKDLDLDEARRIIASASRHRISTTVSTIVGFPDETRDDLRQTIGFVVNAAREERAHVQIHLLAPLPATPLTRRHQDRLTLDLDVYRDTEGGNGSAEERAVELPLIAAHPELFPNFYVFPTLLPLQYVDEARAFIRHALRRCRWLMVALHQESGDMLGLFDEWRAARGGPAPQGRYYRELPFVRSFLAFVRATYAGRGHDAIDVMLQYYEGLLNSAAQGARDSTMRAAAGVDDPAAMPMLAEGIRLLTLRGSAIAVIERLKAHESPTSEEATRERGLVVERTKADLYQLTELPEIPAAVLALCDGRRRTDEVIARFSSSGITFGHAPLPVVCRATLDHLHQSGYLRFVSPEPSS